ncbi:hypothetical protein H4R18_000470 [Coemansia javaensis]|uniref:Uncharacterized protein n=1 Tax=Coemansia javaensis TaxID=2761396 RepID=A0A9W8HJN0_9FUNG|nr:hypothetical protein H4R18_000470 [Coemansia javaensis]
MSETAAFNYAPYVLYPSGIAVKVTSSAEAGTTPSPGEHAPEATSIDMVLTTGMLTETVTVVVIPAMQPSATTVTVVVEESIQPGAAPAEPAGDVTTTVTSTSTVTVAPVPSNLPAPTTTTVTVTVTPPAPGDTTETSTVHVTETSLEQTTATRAGETATVYVTETNTITHTETATKEVLSYQIVTRTTTEADGIHYITGYPAQVFRPTVTITSTSTVHTTVTA